MRLELTGRTAVVTGSSGGIGRAVIAALSEAGATAYGFDLRRPDGEDPRFLEVDVADPAAVTSAIAQVTADTGSLDFVVHCAGITRDKMLWKQTDADWADVLGVNLTGGFNLLRAATPHLRATTGAAAVLVASINGERGKRGQANYAASKGGLIALGKTAARELGYFGVRVNMISPGLISGTPMTDGLSEDVLARAREEAALSRAGQPEDVAHAVVFLLSGLAAHITGQVLRVDGGQLI